MSTNFYTIDPATGDEVHIAKRTSRGYVFQACPFLDIYTYMDWTEFLYTYNLFISDEYGTTIPLEIFLAGIESDVEKNEKGEADYVDSLGYPFIIKEFC